MVMSQIYATDLDGTINLQLKKKIWNDDKCCFVNIKY